MKIPTIFSSAGPTGGFCHCKIRVYMLLDINNIPRHIAIIMDGNGRWAKNRGKMRVEGHREGMKRVKEVIRCARQAGVRYLTLFTFSSENWKRSESEISLLMRALDNYLKNNIKELQEGDIRLKVIGRRRPIPDYVWDRLTEARDLTKNNTGLTVILAFNYGARAEIIDAVKSIIKESSEGRLDIKKLDEEKFGDFLYTTGIPDPDLLIRTSAEVRLSNFLLWQLSYAELYFPKVLWPDFKEQEFKEAILEYQKRARRFGGV